MVLCSLASDFRIATGTETTGEIPTDVQLDVGIRHEQGLGIGIDGDELNTLQAGVDHAVDRVATPAADADDFDDS